VGNEASAEIQRNFIEFPTLFVVGIIVFVVVSVVAGFFFARKREAQEKQDAMRKRQNQYK